MIRNVAVLCTLAIGSQLFFGSAVRADETRVDVIFTGVVPPTCSFELPNGSDLSEMNQIQSRSADAIQMHCNDNAQVRYRDVEPSDASFPSSTSPSNPDISTQNTMTHGTLTITPE